MRLHRPVALHQQPHLGIPEPNPIGMAPTPVWGKHGHYKGTMGFFQGGVTPPVQANGQIPTNAMAVAGAGFARGGAVGYDTGGSVQGGGGYYSDPNAGTLDTSQFTQDPTNTDSSGAGNYGVDTNQLVTHANQVYAQYQQQLQQQWQAEQDAMGGGAQDGGGSQGEEQSEPSGQNEQSEGESTQGYAEGGIVEPGGGGNAGQEEQDAMQGGAQDAGPGPAGPGVTPQNPSGNPGRPGWTDPNSNAANDKNFYQNVTSMPATSPSRGTSYQQPTPVGGQRGQENYSKTPGSSNVWPTPVSNQDIG